MIRPDKLAQAVFALQGVMVAGRTMAYEGAPHERLADLLDAAEYLPWLISCATDETENFREWLEYIGENYGCAYVLQAFDDPAGPPRAWVALRP